MDWARVCEEKQRLEEVQRRGREGGTAIILSALRAVTDLSGLRGERRASGVPCDPRLLYGMLQIFISVGKDCKACVCMCDYTDVYLVCV